MKLKDAVYENCSECGRQKREISPEQFGCDQCSKPIEPYGNDERLDVKLFHKNHEETEDFYFCSWACVFKFLRSGKATTDYFVTLPYVNWDHKIKGRRALDFFAELRKWQP